MLRQRVYVRSLFDDDAVMPTTKGVLESVQPQHREDDDCVAPTTDTSHDRVSVHSNPPDAAPTNGDTLKLLSITYDD